MNKTKEWTEAHRREGRAFALARLAKLVREEGNDALDKLDEEVENAGFEDQWRPGSILSFVLRLDAKGMRGALRRVRDLAEGRKVREVNWYVHDGRGARRDSLTYEHATRMLAIGRKAEAAGAPGRSRIVRVTRIRKAAR